MSEETYQQRFYVFTRCSGGYTYDKRAADELLGKADAEIAALRAECARKDEALNELHQLAALRHDPASGKIIEAALTPSDAGKRYAAMARVCEDARWIRANADIRPHSTRGAGAAGNGMTRLEVFQERLDSLDAALRELEK